MSRKFTRRRVWALVNPIDHAIEGARLCNDRMLNTLRIRELATIEAFRTGMAGLQEWADMTALMNVCEHMATHGVGPEAMETCNQAHSHLIEAAKRYEKTQKMGMSGMGLQCMRDLYEWHDLQRTSISRAEYERHIKQTTLRVKSKAPEVTDVLECVNAN